MAYIEFNGTQSDKFGLRITNEVEHESTGLDISTVVVPGRDGELLLSNQRLKAVEKSFPFWLNAEENVTQTQEAISDWLNVEGYKPLVLSWDPDFTYFATVIKTFSVQEVLRNFGKLKVTFLVHPIKYYQDGMLPQPITNGMTLTGKGNVNAKPIIRLVGSGDCTLKINGRKTKLKGIQQGITLDMQSNTIYQGVQGAWDKLVRSNDSVKPYLDSGRNTISWDGDFQIEITPYWGVKL